MGASVLIFYSSFYPWRWETREMQLYLISVTQLAWISAPVYPSLSLNKTVFYAIKSLWFTLIYLAIKLDLRWLPSYRLHCSILEIIPIWFTRIKYSSIIQVSRGSWIEIIWMVGLAAKLQIIVLFVLIFSQSEPWGKQMADTSLWTVKLSVIMEYF